MSSLAKIAYSRPGRHPIIAGRLRVRKEIMKVHARGKCSLYINNKAFERATRRCDEGKYSASISVRGCLSILDEYKVLRFRLPPSPSRRNKFALARVKRGESPRSAGGRTNRVKEGRGERVRCRSRRTGGGEKKRRRKSTREEMEEANGKRRRKSRSAQLQTAMGIFETTPNSSALAISSVSHFSAPYSFLRRFARRAAAIEYQRQSARETRGVYERLCRFHVMRNLACTSKLLSSTGF